MLRRSVSASVRPLSACAPSTVSQVIVVDVERRKGGVEAQCLRQRPLIMTWERRSLCSLFSQLQCPPSLPSPYLSWCHGCSDAPSYSPRRGRRGLSTDSRALPLSFSLHTGSDARPLAHHAHWVFISSPLSEHRARWVYYSTTHRAVLLSLLAC